MRQTVTLVAIALTAALLTAAMAKVGDQPARATRDDGRLRELCYIADGRPHPLSSITSCAGIDTTGWTLAQWKTKLPAATSLQGEVDRAALQSLIDASGDAAFLRIAGTAVIDEPLVACTKLTLVGDGPKSSMIRQISAGKDLLRFCVDGQPQSYPGFALVMRDMALECGNDAYCGRGVNADFTKIITNAAYFDNVTIRPAIDMPLKKGEFVEGLHLVNPADWVLQNSRIYGNFPGRYDDGHTCIYIRVTDHRPWHHLLRNVCGYWETGIYLDITSSGWMEGLKMLDTDYVGTLDHIHLVSAAAGGINQVEDIGHEGEIWRSALRTTLANPGAGFKGFTFRDGWSAISAPTGQTGPIAALPHGFLDLSGSTNVTISGNTWYYQRDAVKNVGIYTGPRTERVSIFGNSFLENGGAPSRWISLDPSTFGVYEGKNSYNGVGNPVAAPGYSSNLSQASEAFIAAASGGKCHLAGYESFSSINAVRTLTCTDTVVGTTDSNGDLTITYPIAFAKAPRNAVFSNGSVDACAAPAIPVDATQTGTSTKVRLPGCRSKAVRVNYTVTAR